MGMPPVKLKSTWNYERYNDAMMAALAEEPEWVAYKRALDAARASGSAVAMPSYPEAVVRRVQERVDEAATAALLSRLEALGVAEAETGMPAAGKRPVQEEDAAGPSGAGPSDAREEKEEEPKPEPKPEPKRRDLPAPPVDPDFLISAFSTKFAEVWPAVSATMLELHTNAEFKERMQQVDAARASGSRDFDRLMREAAKEAAIIYASKSPAFDLERARVVALYDETTAAERERAREREENAEKLSRYKDIVHKIQNGVVENGHLKRMGIADLKAQFEQMRDNYESKRRAAEAKRSTVERVRRKIVVMREFREQPGGAPVRPGGVGTDYTQLWLRPGMQALKTAALPFGQSVDTYEPSVRREEAVVAEMKERVEAHRERLEKQVTLLEKAKSFVSLEAAKESAVATQAAAIREPARQILERVGMNLLDALPYDLLGRQRKPAARYNELRVDWALIVRAFHKPASGQTYGGMGVGELPEFAEPELPRAGVLEEEVSKQLFDVAVIPYGDDFDTLRVVGRKWCSDPAFARELIRLSIDVAGLQPGTMKSQCYAASNIGRAWLLNVSPTTEAQAQRAHPTPEEAQAALERAVTDRETKRARLQAFGICVEVAARRVRALLGNKRGIADTRADPAAEAPRRFEHCFPYDSNMIGWTIGVNRVKTDNGMKPKIIAYVEGRSEALLNMMMRMGADPERNDGREVGGLRCDWARQTAATLASGGTSRQVAIVVDGDGGEMDEASCGGYGFGGQKQVNEFFEFDVEVKAPESELALAEILRFEDPATPVFNHLSPTVLHLSGPTRNPELLLQFLRGPFVVALCLLSGRYQVLFKDWRVGSRAEPPRQGGHLVLIDPMAQERVQLSGFQTMVNEASAALGIEWTPRRLDTYRDAGQDSALAFLPALARALALAIGVHRTEEGGQPTYPLLGQEDYETFSEYYDDDKKYKPRSDQASAVSDLKYGFGPFCLALAAIAHNEDTVEALGPRTKRIELWS